MKVREACKIVAERRATGFPGRDAAAMRYKYLEAGCLEQKLGATDRNGDVTPEIEVRVHAL